MTFGKNTVFFVALVFPLLEGRRGQQQWFPPRVGGDKAPLAFFFSPFSSSGRLTGDQLSFFFFFLSTLRLSPLTPPFSRPWHTDEKKNLRLFFPFFFFSLFFFLFFLFFSQTPGGSGVCRDWTFFSFLLRSPSKRVIGVVTHQFFPSSLSFLFSFASFSFFFLRGGGNTGGENYLFFFLSPLFFNLHWFGGKPFFFLAFFFFLLFFRGDGGEGVVMHLCFFFPPLGGLETDCEDFPIFFLIGQASFGEGLEDRC